LPSILPPPAPFQVRRGMSCLDVPFLSFVCVRFPVWSLVGFRQVDSPWAEKRPLQQAPRGGFREGRCPAAQAMGELREKAAHRPSACIWGDLGAQLRPLFCTTLVSGSRLCAVRRSLQQASRGGFREGGLPGAHAMEVTTEESGHRPSACIWGDLGAQLRPLFCTTLVSGGRLWAVKRSLQRAPRGGFREGGRPGAHAMEVATEEAGHRPSACRWGDLRAQLRPLFCTTLVFGSRLCAVKRSLQQAPRGRLLTQQHGCVWGCRTAIDFCSLLVDFTRPFSGVRRGFAVRNTASQPALALPQVGPRVACACA